MTTKTLFSNDQPLRFKIIRPVYETLTVNNNAGKYFEPREAITFIVPRCPSVRFLGRETREHFWAAHNHHSGDPTPSAEDREITARIKEASVLLGIRLLDHVIIGTGRHYSFADQGLL
jgi:hypothetical protein